MGDEEGGGGRRPGFNSGSGAARDWLVLWTRTIRKTAVKKFE